MCRVRLRVLARLFGFVLAASFAIGSPASAQTDGGLKGPPPAVEPEPPTQCPDNMDAFAGGDETLTCVCPAEAMGRGSVWGTDIYTADSATCRAAMHAGVAGRRGGTVTVRMLPGRERYPGTTRNGVQSSNYRSYAASFRFEGGQAGPATPMAPQAAAAPEQCPDDMTAFGGTDETLTCVCPAPQTGRGSVWGTNTYTADSATCRAALHAGTLTPRGGTVTVEMLPGEGRYLGTTRNGVQSLNHPAYAASYRFSGGGARAAAPPGAEPAPEQCPDDMTAFSGTDETLTCVCPAAQTGRGSVWGTDIYTADSGTCRAALHARTLTPRGGTVTVEMLPGEGRYLGTTRNGVQSLNYPAYGASYRFRSGGGDGAPRAALPAVGRAAAPAQCPDDLTAFEGTTEALTCVCPGELTLRGTVWGSGPYTADSATCRAAVHAGVIGLSGGTVTARMGPGEARYPASARNGVQSTEFGEYGASVRFEGGQRAKDTAPVQAAVAETLRRSGQVQLYVTFRTGSADLDIGAAAVLGEVRDALLADPDLRLRLAGHTDSTGPATVNRPLSVRRAEAVRAWLAANGIAPDRLVAEGRGPDEPIADNATEAGRALNRRVQATRVP